MPRRANVTVMHGFGNFSVVYYVGVVDSGTYNGLLMFSFCHQAQQASHRVLVKSLLFSFSGFCLCAV